MKKITKEHLIKWLEAYPCFYYLFRDTLYNTGYCAFMCEEFAMDLAESPFIEEVTDKAEEIHGQFAYEVEQNSCRLFKFQSRFKDEVIIAYFDIE